MAVPYWLAFPIAFAVGWVAERLSWLRPGAAWAAAIVGGTPLWLGGIPTEMGSRYSRHAWHPIKGRVEPGTNAALTWPGTLASLAGALLFVPWALWVGASPLSALAGLVGSLADTLLGLLEDRVGWWSNDLTNLLATVVGGLVALLLWSLLGVDSYYECYHPLP